MACGLPVIATAVGGVPDVVQHGITGYLVHCRKAAKLASHCIELIDDPAKARAMGQSAQVIARRKFSIERMISETLELYSLNDEKASQQSRGNMGM
jgi:glycosyltransferase involved in cell wall biosynthesis